MFFYIHLFIKNEDIEKVLKIKKGIVSSNNEGTIPFLFI